MKWGNIPKCIYSKNAQKSTYSLNPSLLLSLFNLYTEAEIDVLLRKFRENRRNKVNSMSIKRPE